jgi:tRNA threonylcarbamoyladenosine biosynthesis protein TsaE
MELEFGLESIDSAAELIMEAAKGKTIISFSGEMGAGKTTLIHALCRRMGINGSMGSPTFSIINEYEYKGAPVYHIDLYRCKDEDEAIRAGVEDCLFSGCLCLVEWPSKAPGLFPDDTIRVSITETEDHARLLSVT